jgi:pyruvate,water dikinase
VNLVTLEQAVDERSYGSKASRLGAACRAGLPVPPGLALDWSTAAAVAAGRGAAEISRIVATLKFPVAVRSSAIGEDGADASFAGQHLTVLNVRSQEALLAAIVAVVASARAPQAIAYRQRLGIAGEPRMGVVVQELVAAECAGVLFTKNPISGKDERVIEASWGLGEAVVAGLVTPDRYRVDRSGAVLEQCAGEKDLAIVPLTAGGVEEVSTSEEQTRALCLSPQKLARLNELAARCEAFAQGHHDLEWAFHDEQLYLLQWRPITR